MATSIFTKLAKQGRHNDIFDSMNGGQIPGNPRAAGTVGGLAKFGLSISLFSKCCRRSATVGAAAAADAFGEDAPLATMRFRCLACDGIAVDVVPIPANQAEATKDGMPDGFAAEKVDVPERRPESDGRRGFAKGAKRPRAVIHEPPSIDSEPVGEIEDGDPIVHGAAVLFRSDIDALDAAPEISIEDVEE